MIAPGAGSVWVVRWAGGRTEPSSRADSRMAMTCLLRSSLWSGVSRGCPTRAWAERPPTHRPFAGAVDDVTARDSDRPGASARELDRRPAPALRPPNACGTTGCIDQARRYMGVDGTGTCSLSAWTGSDPPIGDMLPSA